MFEDSGLPNIWEPFPNRPELLDPFAPNFWPTSSVCVKVLNCEDVDWVGPPNDPLSLGGPPLNIPLGADDIPPKGALPVPVMAPKGEYLVVVEFPYTLDVDVPNAFLALAETELTAPLPAVDDENTLPCPKNAGVGWEFRDFTAFPDEDICILLLPCLFVAPNVAPVPNDDVPPSIDKKKEMIKVLSNAINRKFTKHHA